MHEYSLAVLRKIPSPATTPSFISGQLFSVHVVPLLKLQRMPHRSQELLYTKVPAPPLARHPRIFGVRSVRLLVERDDVKAEFEDCYSRMSLLQAVEGRYKGVVRLLIGWNDVDADSRDDEGRRPLA